MRDLEFDCSRSVDSVWLVLWRCCLYATIIIAMVVLILFDVIGPVPAMSLSPAGALMITFGLTRAFGQARKWCEWFRLMNYIVGLLASVFGGFSTAMASDHSGLVIYVLLVSLYGSLIFMTIETEIETMAQPRVDRGDNL